MVLRTEATRRHFPIEIPARPGKILTIREFDVVSEHVLFPTHPGSRIKSLWVEKNLCVSAASSGGKLWNFHDSLISSVCFHAHGRRSSWCRILVILVSLESLRYLLPKKYGLYTELNLGSRDMILRMEAIGMFLMPRGHFLIEIPAWPEELLTIWELHVIAEVTLLLKGFNLQTKLSQVGRNLPTNIASQIGCFVNNT